MSAAISAQEGPNGVGDGEDEGESITRPAGGVFVVAEDKGGRGIMVAGAYEECD